MKNLGPQIWSHFQGESEVYTSMRTQGSRHWATVFLLQVMNIEKQFLELSISCLLQKIWGMYISRKKGKKSYNLSIQYNHYNPCTNFPVHFFYI